MERRRSLAAYYGVAGVITVLVIRRVSRLLPAGLLEVPLSTLLNDLAEGRLQTVLISADALEAQLKDSRVYRSRLVPFIDRAHLVDLLAKRGVIFGAKTQSLATRLLPGLLSLLPVAYFAFLARMLYKMQEPGGKSDGVGKRARKQPTGAPPIRFDDVAGIDDAKVELAEIVDFLKRPGRYSDIGARLPRGVLLSGPSGTGKTLLARAVATEAGVPFLSCSASDFVEMLVGRGAARVRDLFQRGVASAPCIIFIDELDALAKARGGLNSNDEREQTLMQLLTEMDGFETQESNVLVMAATNRPQILDSALTRPGRFDRHISVQLPDQRGREAILKVHSRKVQLADDVVLARVAQQTDGFSGAVLANVINEGALLAVRESQRVVCARHLQLAVGRAKQYQALYHSDYQTMLDTLG